MKHRASLWIIALMLTMGCVAKPAALRPTAEQQAEQTRLQQQAETQAAAVAAQRKHREQRLRAIAEFTSLQARFEPLLSALRRWDAAGDERTEMVDAELAVARRLGEFEPLNQACGLQFHALAERPEPDFDPPELAGRVRFVCDLVARAQSIAQRQILMQVKVFLGLPPWLADVPTRYQQRGWVAWHQLLELLNLEAAFERQAKPWRAAAAAVGAVISPESLLKYGLEGRRGLLVALQKGLMTLSFPNSFEDKALASQLDKAWATLQLEGPLAGQRGPLLQVRALDPQWQILTGDRGRTLRSQRDFAVLFAATSTAEPLAGCWILWGTAERAAGKQTFRLADDLRKVRCPNAAPVSTAPTVAQP